MSIRGSEPGDPGRGRSQRLGVAVGKRIAHARRDHPSGLLSQRRLAEQVGVAVSTIRKIESGERRLALDLMEQIASALRVDPHDLVCGVARSKGLECAAAPLLRFVMRSRIRPNEAEALSRLLQGLWDDWRCSGTRPPSR